MISLRPYQQECLDDLIARWDAGAVRVPSVLSMALGKTVIFSHLQSRWHADLAERYELGKRVLVIAHTDELISQAAGKARMINPHLSVGVVKAGQNEAHAQVVVSSRQTLQSAKRREQIRNVGLIIIDECHHCHRGNTYGRTLEHFGAFEGVPRCKVAGFTATLARGDDAKLSTVWENCTFKRDVIFGIRNGFLLDVRGERVVVPGFDMSRVRKVAGDYRDDDLAQEMERTFAPETIAREYSKRARAADGSLRQGIAAWPLVATAYLGAEAFEREGIPSAVVHGGMPKDERRAVLRRHQRNEIVVIHQVNVLVEGFDAPWMCRPNSGPVVVLARPTRSAPLYQQLAGRGLRPNLEVPAEQRDPCLLLDVVGAGATHDLRSLCDLSPERKLQQDSSELSLLDLAIQDEERQQVAAVFDDPTHEQYAGETEVVAFDPLARDRVWQQTPEGTYFMSAGGDAYVFLSESWAGDPGTWDVVYASKLGPQTWPKVPGTQGLTQYVGLPLDEALICAEDEAVERGGLGTKTLTSRKAAWRRAEPTEAQLRRARSLGIVVPLRQDLTLETGSMDRLATPSTSAWGKGELSEKIDAVMAARRIDPLVRLVKANNPR